MVYTEDSTISSRYVLTFCSSVCPGIVSGFISSGIVGASATSYQEESKAQYKS
ncbi:MAG: hypothetical protein Q4E76_03930 [Tissierellia bacterium]|nr:hypothetical protein [Tissierellia bacterium]